MKRLMLVLLALPLLLNLLGCASKPKERWETIHKEERKDVIEEKEKLE